MRKVTALLVALAAAIVLAGCAHIGTHRGHNYVVVSSVPADKVYVAVPGGYKKCFVVPAGWHEGNWVPAHKVCKYVKDGKVSMWVSGYWRCVDSDPSNGVCNNWDWVAAHWSD